MQLLVLGWIVPQIYFVHEGILVFRGVQDGAARSLFYYCCWLTPERAEYSHALKCLHTHTHTLTLDRLPTTFVIKIISK